MFIIHKGRQSRKFWVNKLLLISIITKSFKLISNAEPRCLHNFLSEIKHFKFYFLLTRKFQTIHVVFLQIEICFISRNHVAMTWFSFCKFCGTCGFITFFILGNLSNENFFKKKSRVPQIETYTLQKGASALSHVSIVSAKLLIPL